MSSRKNTFWPRAGIIRASMAVHAAALVGLVEPQAWPWIAGALLGNHALLAAGGLWPRSAMIGPNLRRLPRTPASDAVVSLTFDDGPDPAVTPTVLEILDRYGARASFFCIACQAAKFPDVVAEISRRGHRVENHSYSHSHRFSLMGRSALERELSHSQRILTQLAGSAPAWFRAPAGLRNFWLDGLLQRHDLELVSWTRRAFDTVSNDSRRVQNRLTRGLSSGDILMLHDRGSAIDGSGRPMVLEVLPRLLDVLAERDLRSVPIPPPDQSFVDVG